MTYYEVMFENVSDGVSGKIKWASTSSTPLRLLGHLLPFSRIGGRTGCLQNSTHLSFGPCLQFTLGIEFAQTGDFGVENCEFEDRWGRRDGLKQHETMPGLFLSKYGWDADSSTMRWGRKLMKMCSNVYRTTM
jgi:hypothetical protein